MFIIHLSQSGEGQLDLLNTVCRVAWDIHRYFPIAYFCSNICLYWKGGKKVVSQINFWVMLGGLGLRLRLCLGLELGLRQEAHRYRCSVGARGRISGGVVCKSYQNTCVCHWDSTGHLKLQFIPCLGLC